MTGHPTEHPRNRRVGLVACLSLVGILAGIVPASAGGGELWTTLPSLPTPLGGHATAAAPCPSGQAGTCVYEVGGSDNGIDAVGTVEAYNQRTNAWSMLPSAPTVRYFLAAAAAPCPLGQAGTCVYAVGGYDSGGIPVDTVEAYSPRTNAWSTLSSLPTARALLGAAAAPCPPGQAGTCVYAVGGRGAGIVDTVEAYNPATGAWSTLPSLPTARGWLAAAAAPCPLGQAGTCVYAVGGYDGVGTIGTVEAYSPVTNAWSTLPSMPTARYVVAAAAAPCPPGQAGTCVYAVGGADKTNNALSTVEAYNTATDAWITLPSLPTARYALGTAAAPCPRGQAGTCVYAVGGVDTAFNVVGTVEAFDPPPSRAGARGSTRATGQSKDNRR